MSTTDDLCHAGHVVSSGATWRCYLPKGHGGEHDDGLGERWTDDNPPPMSAVYAAQQVGRSDPANYSETPTYAHDPHCNTVHEAGPEPCPPARDVPDPEVDHAAGVVRYAWRTDKPPRHRGCPFTGWIHEATPPWRVMSTTDRDKLDVLGKSIGTAVEYTGTEDTIDYDQWRKPFPREMRIPAPHPGMISLVALSGDGLWTVVPVTREVLPEAVVGMVDDGLALAYRQLRDRLDGEL